MSVSRPRPGSTPRRGALPTASPLLASVLVLAPVLVLASVLVLGTALAQTGSGGQRPAVGQGQTPNHRTPNQTRGWLPAPRPLAPPTPLLPFDNTRRAPGGVDPEADRPRIEGIEIAPLSEVNPDALGLLNENQGGFGPALWRDSDPAFVAALLPRLPDRYASATQWDLARRLLLSAAPPPRDPDADGRDDASAPGSFLAMRLDRLVTMGDLDGLEQLLGRVPRGIDESQERIAKARVQSRMLAGAVEDGCREVAAGAQRATPYWRKALIACQTVEGQGAEAELGLALLREQGGADDAVFHDFIAALSGAEVSLPAPFAALPLHAALLQFRGLPLPDDTLERGDLGLASALAASERTARPLRVRAGELTAWVGARPPALLRTVYAGFPFTPGLGGEPGDLAEPATRAAQFHQAATAAAQPNEPAALASALAAVDARTLWYRAMVAALSFRLTEVRPSAANAQWAGALGRALYVAGRFEHAAAWTRAAREAGRTNPGAARGGTMLWPFGRLLGAPGFGPAGLTGGEGLAAWRAARGGDPEHLDELENLLRALFAVLRDRAPPAQDMDQHAGQHTGRDTARRMAQTATRPSPAAATGGATGDPARLGAPNDDGSGLLFDLRAASRAGRMGETLLLAIVILGSEDLAMSDPKTAVGVVAALKDVGLELEAQKLAIEIAVAKGV